MFSIKFQGHLIVSMIFFPKFFACASQKNYDKTLKISSDPWIMMLNIGLLYFNFVSYNNRWVAIAKEMLNYFLLYIQFHQTLISDQIKFKSWNMFKQLHICIMLCSVNTTSHTTQDSLQPVIATPVFLCQKVCNMFLTHHFSNK